MMEIGKLVTIEEHESYLRQKSLSVNIQNENIEKYIVILEEFCKKNEVMAMAAIQLGIPKRIIYLKNTNLDIIKKMQTNTESAEEREYNEARVLINPIIIEKEGLTEYWEACASCLNNLGHVRRPYKILIEYEDIKGKKHQDTFEGFESTVLSHEMDHLDGILHMDIADELLIMPKEDRKKFRQTHGYHIISKNGKYQELLKKIKNTLLYINNNIRY